MKKALYFVALIPNEPVLGEVSRIKKEVHERFGTKAAMKSPPHVTLFPPFWFGVENEKTLTDALQQPVKNFAAFPVALENFDRFDRRTLFVHVVLNEELQRLESAVKSVFFSLPGMKLQPDERPFHPHMTIGNRDWPDGNFDEAWKEFQSKKYAATFIAAKISLLRLDPEKWNVVGESNLS